MSTTYSAWSGVNYYNGYEPRVGDVVECCVDHYSTQRRGQQSKVTRIEDGNIVLFNDGPYGSSPYRTRNFSLVRRGLDQENAIRQPKKEKVMLHIAVMYETGQSLDNLGKMILAGTAAMFVDTSADVLKERVRFDIMNFPDHRWLILSANTIGEIASPPVRFRAV